MINVVARPPIEAADAARVSLVCFDHVLCDLRNTPMDWDAARFPCNGPVAVRPITCPFTGYVSKDVPGYVTIKIEHLSAIRLDPLCSGENLVLDQVREEHDASVGNRIDLNLLEATHWTPQQQPELAPIGAHPVLVEVE